MYFDSSFDAAGAAAAGAGAAATGAGAGAACIGICIIGAAVTTCSITLGAAFLMVIFTESVSKLTSLTPDFETNFISSSISFLFIEGVFYEWSKISYFAIKRLDFD
jgi:hypothetical protein